MVITSKIFQCTGVSTYGSLTTTSCGSFQSPSNTYIWSTSGTYMDTIINSTGCDSIITINLTILNSSSYSYSAASCDTFISPGNKIITSSGIYSDTISNALNCDSILSIAVTINNSTNTTINQSGCDSLVVGGQVYFSSGTYFQQFTSGQGCDSNITLNLMINVPTSNAITHTACNSYTLNGQTYTNTGTYNQLLQNSQGCDSTLTLNLTINNSPSVAASSSGLQLSATPVGATYQWIKCNPYSIINGATSQTYTVTANGEYAVVVTQNGCSDTSNCIKFTNVGINEIALTGISVYPNPTSNTFVISSENILKEATLILRNALGQVVYRKENLSGTEFEINISKFSNGIYTLELQEGDKLRRVKLLKR